MAPGVAEPAEDQWDSHSALKAELVIPGGDIGTFSELELSEPRN